MEVMGRAEEVMGAWKARTVVDVMGACESCCGRVGSFWELLKLMKVI